MLSFKLFEWVILTVFKSKLFGEILEFNLDYDEIEQDFVILT